ncbi:hypothetical protein K469DRAFT_671232 [Zopfia rhizophila CBS 207.26]|uniref:Uncharacterized protein n=1 Tax=Zopfia rhizophila CBS 207.26 TaxID=1314779 RepID=A0A6A6DQB0_9PEZI|nr:hypothetical protein K469DRAFT_638375 [Zopfia rhizophila CBS 207.26]KAF2181473.1 hypothetical protein K469DRAFT_671232 [Zopfia rhizophila CBS 207.26]
MLWKDPTKYDGDHLRPTPRQSSKILSRSRRLWRQLLHSASFMKCYPLSCSNIEILLNQTPSIPDHPNIKEIVENKLLFLEGSSQWNIGRSKRCGIDNATKKSRSQKVLIGLDMPGVCHLADDILPTWPGFESGLNKSSSGNYLAILVLGWSYVLSARLLELRKKSEKDKILYTDNKAMVFTNSAPSEDGCFSVYIGDVDTHECRWWAAILATGCGWRASLYRSSRQYYPPWSCHLNSDNRFNILRDDPATESLDVLGDSPSSIKAWEYLCKFAKMHHVYDQLLAAFVAALTLPRQGRFGARIVLPRPQSMTGRPTHAELVDFERIPPISHLPHYMALSCIPNVLSSSMFGCFWEPGVDCNVASEWLYPILQEIVPSLKKEEQCQIIVQMMATRRPSSAPLWLGAAITGLLPKLLDISTQHLPPISLEATVWTDSSQSFMDPQFHRQPRIFKSIKGRQFIRREDEYRLLYITDVDSRHYASPPLSSWSPFGAVELKNAAFEVQQHHTCGHRLIYSQWNWQLENELPLYDSGMTFRLRSHSRERLFKGFRFQMACIWSQLRRQWIRLRYFAWSFATRSQWVLPGVSRNEVVSRSATRCIFSWALSDGIRSDEMGLWKHEWLNDLLDDESEDGESSVISG